MIQIINIQLKLKYKICIDTSRRLLSCNSWNISFIPIVAGVSISGATADEFMAHLCLNFNSVLSERCFSIKNILFYINEKV